MKVALVPLGPVAPALLEDLRSDLAAYGIVGELRATRALPVAAFDGRRNQYRAERVLDALPVRGEPTLAVTSEDLYAEGLNFVFGLADVGAPRAVISTYRLRSPDARKFRDRILKEGVHELGHTIGLDHCSSPTCVMRFSDSLEEADEKSAEFCDGCRARARRALGGKA